ncbi:hypothetical protein CPC08DRAFT_472670 [Agrocybe pediades]|nr:hypothetical protein CPC08DRAFT_472670 [Agrocybe pediades]
MSSQPVGKPSSKHTSHGGELLYVGRNARDRYSNSSFLFLLLSVSTPTSSLVEMRSFLTLTSLATLLVLAAEASTVPSTFNARRFALHKSPSKSVNLTATERYAMELTHRAPTRRSESSKLHMPVFFANAALF